MCNSIILMRTDKGFCGRKKHLLLANFEIKKKCIFTSIAVITNYYLLTRKFGFETITNLHMDLFAKRDHHSE